MGFSETGPLYRLVSNLTIRTFVIGFDSTVPLWEMCRELKYLGLECNFLKQSMVVHPFNPSTWERGANFPDHRTFVNSRQAGTTGIFSFKNKKQQQKTPKNVIFSLISPKRYS